MPVSRIVMPKRSEAMETGKVIKWLKCEGDRVDGGDILAEVETDKADVEVEASGTGVLRAILVPAGAQAAVGTLLAVIAEPGDDVSTLVDGPRENLSAAVVRPALVPLPAIDSGVGERRVRASPMARKIAAQAGVELASLEGSGPGGLIVRRDVEAAVPSAPASAAAASIHPRAAPIAVPRVTTSARAAAGSIADHEDL